MPNKKKDPVAEARRLLSSPYVIAGGPEAETAIPIIKGLLNEIKRLKKYIDQRGG